MAYKFAGFKQSIYEAMVEADPTVDEMPIRELEAIVEARREAYQARFGELFESFCAQYKTREKAQAGDWDACLKLEKQAELAAKEIAMREALTF